MNSSFYYVNTTWILPRLLPDAYCYKHKEHYFTFGWCPQCQRDRLDEKNNKIKGKK